MNLSIVERIYPDDDRVKPETIAHHKARYEFAARLFSGGRYLDLACGTGYGTDRIRQEGCEATGVDTSAEAIGYARKHYPKCEFVQVDITGDIPLTRGFNMITIFEAIEHLPFLPAVETIKKCKDLLLPDGYFILSTPNDTNDKYNTFHRSEWNYGTIKNILGSYFLDVKIFGQDWDTAEISDKNVRDNDFYIAVAKGWLKI